VQQHAVGVRGGDETDAEPFAFEIRRLLLALPVVSGGTPLE
jgi:hypothetical protein